MKAADAILIIEKFTNDILGTIIPGVVLLCILKLLGIVDALAVFSGTDFSATALFLMTAYLLGQVLDQVFNCSERLLGHQRNSPEMENAKVFKQLLLEQTAGWGAEDSKAQALIKELEVGRLRSMAMTMSEEAKYVSRRFRFLQILFSSSATALFVCVLFCLSMIVLEAWLRASFERTQLELLLIASVSTVVGALLLFRSYEFRRRSDRVCFDSAVTELLQRKIETKNQK